MTRNQIDWQNMLISKSRATEEARHNLATEHIAKQSNREAARANRAREDIQLRTLDNEIAKLQEAIRNNDVVNYINRLKHDESVRTNLAKEANERLNISTQHLDRAEGNRIAEAWNKMQQSARALEHLTTKRFKSEELANQAQKIANDYEIAKDRLEIDKLKAASDVAKTFSSPLTHIGQILKR